MKSTFDFTLNSTTYSAEVEWEYSDPTESRGIVLRDWTMTGPSARAIREANSDEIEAAILRHLNNETE